LSGMESIDSGEVIFNGKDLSSFKEKYLTDIRRQQMGFVFQQAAFLKDLSLIDNIILPMMRDRHKQRKSIVNAAMKLMHMTGIEALANRLPHQVSGGQLQRAGICRAMIHQPKIIFADEPTGALNSRTADHIMH